MRGVDLRELERRECLSDCVRDVGAEHLNDAERRVMAVLAMMQFNRVQDGQQTHLSGRIAVEESQASSERVRLLGFGAAPDASGDLLCLRRSDSPDMPVSNKCFKLWCQIPANDDGYLMRRFHAS